MYHYELVDPTVVAVHREFASLFRLLHRFPPAQRIAAERNLRRVYQGFNRRLDLLAAASARDASAKIRDRITATSLRPDTGRRPHLRAVVRSRPAPKISGLSTGAVLVADENWLNKAQGTDGYSYWWAQEYGMPAEAGAPPEAPRASMVGRVIRGYFAGGGGKGPWSAPNQNQLRVHPVFLPRAGGPPGTIQNPLKPRHFVRDGTLEALKDWQTGMEAISTQTLAQARIAVGIGVTRRGRRP